MALWRAVLIAILPPSICMGIGFPLALGIAKARDPRRSIDRSPEGGEAHRRAVFAERRRRDRRIADGRFRCCRGLAASTR